MIPWKIRRFPVKSGRLLELESLSFSPAPSQGQHVSVEELGVPVFKCTRTQNPRMPASFFLQMGKQT